MMGVAQTAAEQAGRVFGVLVVLVLVVVFVPRLWRWLTRGETSASRWTALVIVIVLGGGLIIGSIQWGLGGFQTTYEPTGQADLLFLGVEGHEFAADPTAEAEGRALFEAMGLGDELLDIAAYRAYRGRRAVGGAIALEAVPGLTEEEGFAEDFMRGVSDETGQTTSVGRIRGTLVHEARGAPDAGHPHIVMWIRGNVIVVTASDRPRAARRLAAAMIEADRGA